MWKLRHDKLSVKRKYSHCVISKSLLDTCHRRWLASL